MPPQQPREKDAKVEGRDPLKQPKNTMGLFRVLTTRLLKVTPEEVKEQQRLYEESRPRNVDKKPGLLPGKKQALPSAAIGLDKAKKLIPHKNK